MNIYIKVEVETRELLSRLLLGMYAAARKHNVLLGDGELLSLVEQNKLKPGIIFEKSITPSVTRIKQLKNYRKFGSKLTSIDEEGVIKDDFNTLLNSRFSEQTILLSDKIFCWGKYDYDSLINLFPNQKQKFIKTGNPRVSLWSRKYKHLFINKKIEEKKYILISSNFSVAVSSQRLSEIVKFFLSTNYFNDKKYVENFYNRMSLNLQILFKFINAINILTERFQNINFIVRPHPTESVELWENFFRKRKNLLITKELTLSDWIENSEIIIHNGCTAGVEAFARKKKIISYEPLDLKTSHTYPNKFGYTAKDEIELQNLISQFYCNDKRYQKIDEIQNLEDIISRFGNFEQDNFIQNIILEWETLNDKKLSQKNSLFNIKLKNSLRMIKKKFIKPYVNEKFPPLQRHRIANLVNNLKKVDNNLNNVDFELLGPNLIKLKCTE